MPRINRTDVIFKAAAHTWIARFVHSHNEVEGIIHRLDDGKFITVKHLTQCKLGYVGSTTFLNGFSMCSMKDEYNWRIGLKRSLQKALERGGFCKVGKDGKVEVLRPAYGEILAAFYHELPIKDYYPHRPEDSVNREKVKALANSIATALEGELVPAETRNGTYHLGSD